MNLNKFDFGMIGALVAIAITVFTSIAHAELTETDVVIIDKIIMKNSYIADKEFCWDMLDGALTHEKYYVIDDMKSSCDQHWQGVEFTAKFGSRLKSIK